MNKLVLLCCFILSLPSYAQYDNSSFKLASPTNDCQSLDNIVLTNDTTIDLNIDQSIYGLTISGRSSLSDDTSYVRVTLKDEQGHEHLIYENYLLLSGRLISNFNKIGIESIILNGAIPRFLNIRIENATICLNELQYTTSPLPGSYSLLSGNAHLLQASTLIDKLNQNLKINNLPWRAGITSLSEKTFEEKKSMFGGDMPYLGGLEYYAGGIFVSPGYNPQNNVNDLYVKEVDWRNRHGKNWITSIKDQCYNTCWAFSSIAMVESYINLYYNKIINMDLSEQDLISCATPDTYNPIKQPWSVSQALNYIKGNGVVKEDCFPYKCLDNCDNKCKNPNEKIRIDNYKILSMDSENTGMFKSYLLKKPIGLDLYYGKAGHSVNLIGYKKIMEGDSVLVDMSQKEWVKFEKGNPLIGATAWITKDSNSANWGQQGYGYIIIGSWSNSMRIYSIEGKIHSLNYSDSDISCEDNDGDGYYFWGIGDKPSSLPSWIPDEPDGDDSNANLGPMDSYGNLKDLNPNKTLPKIINMLTFWHSDNYIHTHLIIANGGNLIISGNISMYKDATITVLSGGYLEIDGGMVKQANLMIQSGGHLSLRNGGILKRGNGDEFVAEKGAIINIEYGGIE